MTKAELHKMDFDKAIETLYEENNLITTYEVLKDFAIDKLQHDDVGYALHILNAIYNTVGEWYDYDFSMGTLELPTPITTIEDLEDYCEEEKADESI